MVWPTHIFLRQEAQKNASATSAKLVTAEEWIKSDTWNTQ